MDSWNHEQHIPKNYHTWFQQIAAGLTPREYTRTFMVNHLFMLAARPHANHLRHCYSLFPQYDPIYSIYDNLVKKTYNPQHRASCTCTSSFDRKSQMVALLQGCKSNTLERNSQGFHQQHCYQWRNPCRGYVHTQGYINGLVQERRNSIANALELHLSCTNPSIY